MTDTTPDAMPDTMIEFDRVCIVFGNDPGRALPLMDKGQTRAEVQKATGQVLGVHDCSLTVARGEISVLMGLSGSGKSTLLRGVNGLNPVIRGRVPGATLQIVGRNPVAAVRRLGAVPGVEVVGPVPDVRPSLAAARAQWMEPRSLTRSGGSCPRSRSPSCSARVGSRGARIR